MMLETSLTPTLKPFQPLVFAPPRAGSGELKAEVLDDAAETVEVVVVGGFTVEGV
jgi:hypothetical protein